MVYRPRSYCIPCRTKSFEEFSKPKDDSPYERAVRRIEKVTGKPRTDWEHILNHPYVRATDKYAKLLAGQSHSFNPLP